MIRTLFACLVRLYPAPFRTEFGDEMLGVLMQGWRDTRQSNESILFVLKNTLDVCGHALIEHFHYLPQVSNAARVRVVLRAVAFWMCFFHLLIGYDLIEQNAGWLVQVVFAWMLTVACILASRYEFYGGICLITTAVVIGCIVASAVLPLTSLGTALASGISYTVVFIGLGIGFVALGQSRWRKVKNKPHPNSLSTL